MKYKHGIFLGMLFLAVFFIRLYFAFQTPYFAEDDAYFTLRQVEHIRQTGLPLYEDPLSYGGRQYLFLPSFHYVLAFFSLFMPTVVALKVIPNLFATSLIIPVFMIINLITRKENIAFLGGLISAFIPVFVFETTNTASVYTLALPLIVLLMYFFIRINTTKDPKWFIIFFVLLLLTDTSSLFLVFAILLYLVFAWSEGLDIKRGEIELAIFSLFITVLFYIFFFRDALMLHGPSIIYGNLPDMLLDNYFAVLNISESLINIGIVPLLSAIFVSFVYFSRRKKKSVYLPMSSCFIIAVMLAFRLIPILLGLIYLGVMCTILFGEFFNYIIEYFEKTKFSKLKWTVYVLLIIVVVITSMVPSIWGTYALSKNQENFNTIEILKIIPDITDNRTTIAAPPESGHLITYFAEQKNVLDSNYLFVENIENRFKELEQIYTSAVASKPLEIMEKNNIEYILLNEQVKEDYNITRLSYASNRCFPVVISYNETKIYKRRCSLV